MNGLGDTDPSEIGLQVKTRNGLFANEGYGGGVFNGNTAFGSYGADSAMTIPLGALATNKVLPSKCWDKPGFKDCHALAYSEAQKKCGYCAENPDDEGTCGGYTTMANCLERETNAMAWDNCVSSFCPSESPTMQNINLNFTEYKRGEGCSAANTIKNVQFMSGAKTDGLWGPLTQSAYENLVRIQGTTYCELVPGCTGSTPMGGSCSASPAPTTTVPQPGPGPEPEPEPEEPELTGTTQASMGGLLVAGIALALVAGTVAYLGQGKKKR